MLGKNGKVLRENSIIISGKNIENADGKTLIIVQKGDALWNIAFQRLGLGNRYIDIVELNKDKIKNPDLIYPGDKVYVPLFSGVKAIEQEVIRLTNLERQKAGLSPLAHNWELSRVARYKSEDMSNKNYFSHTSPTYGSPFTMIKNFGISYSAAGENIAMGQTTAQAVVQGWMNSSGHRANILSTNFNKIGVGYAKSSSGKIYWTQMFIRQ